MKKIRCVFKTENVIGSKRFQCKEINFKFWAFYVHKYELQFVTYLVGSGFFKFVSLKRSRTCLPLLHVIVVVVVAVVAVYD